MRSICCVLTALVSLPVGYGAEEANSAAPALGVAEQEAAEGFVSLFDGKTLNGWRGATDGYVAEGGALEGYLVDKASVEKFDIRAAWYRLSRSTCPNGLTSGPEPAAWWGAGRSRISPTAPATSRVASASATTRMRRTICASCQP